VCRLLPLLSLSADSSSDSDLLALSFFRF
jgi:hypothetical protein